MLKQYVGINIALRAANEPGITALGDSPLGQEASDRIDELTTDLCDDGPWWFQEATHYASLTALGGNEKQIVRGETFTGGTSAATFTIICANKNRVWLKYIDGTVGGTGETLTGSDSETTLVTSTAYTAIDPNTTWSFDILPETFAKYVALQAGLDLERQYKRGSVDEQVLGRQVFAAQAKAQAFDQGWSNWRTTSRTRDAAVTDAYRLGPQTEDRFTDG